MRRPPTISLAALAARSRRGALAALIATAACASSTAPALAGTYTVSTCHGSAGQSVATSDASYGWHFATGGQTAVGPIDSCASGTSGYLGLELSMQNSHHVGSGDAYLYTAAPGTAVTAYRLWMAGYTRAWDGSNQGVVMVEDSGGTTLLAGGIGPFGAAGLGAGTALDVSGRSTSTIGIHAFCDGPTGFPDCSQGSGQNAWAHVYRAQMITTDNSYPHVSSVSGDATNAGTWHGPVSLAFHAADQGGGVYRMIVQGGPSVAALAAVDTEVIDSAGGQCVDENPSDADPYEFSHAQPCPLSVSASGSVDSAALPDGPQVVQVRVEDVAGNRTTVLGPTTHVIDNQPPAVGAVSVTGGAQVGQTLTCSAPVDGQSPTVVYSWIRASADGSGQAVVAGAASGTYAPTTADVGKKLLCRVTAADMGGSQSSTSTLTSGPFDNGGLVTAVPPKSNGGGGDGGGGMAPIDNGNTPTHNKTPGGAPTDKAPTSKDDSSTVATTPAPSNGTNATAIARVTASWADNGKTRETIAYSAGSSRRTIRGLVTTPTDTPIGGAQLDVIATPTVPGSGPIQKTGLVTRANGRFTLKLEGGIGSRTVTIRYRPSLAASTVGGQAAVTLTVKSHVTLTARAVKGSGGMPRFSFNGTLKGKPFPKPGQLVEIRVRKGRQWVVVGHPVRASATGRFRLAYQVSTHVRKGLRFTFRAETRKSLTWPYAGGASHSVAVTVR